MLRVGILGGGAIGGTVARALRASGAHPCVLTGVVTRSSPTTVDDLISSSDVVVEAAGHQALETYGPHIVRSGVDLLVVSVGALVDERLIERMKPSGRGRLLISAGAIGGLEILKAAALLGPLERVSLESTKPPAVLVQDWMGQRLIRRLKEHRGPVEAFRGTARDAARRFPQSANVAATLGLATVGLDATEVVVVGDPSLQCTRHVIRAAGPAGTYEFAIQNNPSPENPRTSAVVPYAILKALLELSTNTFVGV